MLGPPDRTQAKQLPLAMGSSLVGLTPQLIKCPAPSPPRLRWLLQDVSRRGKTDTLSLRRPQTECQMCPCPDLEADIPI